MPLTIQNINKITEKHSDYAGIKILIETGTYHGNTIFHLAPFFDTLYTIEIKKELYEENLRKHSSNIKFYLGDSTKVLPVILKDINQPIILFLDGHYSHGDTGQGPKDTPLIEELIAINLLHNNNSIIIIDDYHMFGKNVTENWEDITEDSILKCLNPGKIHEHFIENNHLIILLKKV